MQLFDLKGPKCNLDQTFGGKLTVKKWLRGDKSCSLTDPIVEGLRLAWYRPNKLVNTPAKFSVVKTCTITRLPVTVIADPAMQTKYQYFQHSRK